jgi:hypothetical protein
MNRDGFTRDLLSHHLMKTFPSPYFITNLRA